MDSTSDVQVFTVDEAAKLLRLDRKTVYNAVADGAIPAVRIRRRLLIPRAALEKLIGAAAGR